MDAGGLSKSSSCSSSSCAAVVTTPGAVLGATLVGAMLGAMPGAMPGAYGGSPHPGLSSPSPTVAQTPDQRAKLLAAETAAADAMAALARVQREVHGEAAS